MYDYEAQDSDEVSFLDGDLIINCTAIDEGWMTGLVERTGRHGMLPANYVEPAQIWVDLLLLLYFSLFFFLSYNSPNLGSKYLLL